MNFLVKNQSDDFWAHEVVVHVPDHVDYWA